MITPCRNLVVGDARMGLYVAPLSRIIAKTILPRPTGLPSCLEKHSSGVNGATQITKSNGNAFFATSEKCTWVFRAR